jgi:hypothetical protein
MDDKVGLALEVSSLEVEQHSEAFANSEYDGDRTETQSEISSAARITFMTPSILEDPAIVNVSGAYPAPIGNTGMDTFLSQDARPNVEELKFHAPESTEEHWVEGAALVSNPPATKEENEKGERKGRHGGRGGFRHSGKGRGGSQQQSQSKEHHQPRNSTSGGGSRGNRRGSRGRGGFSRGGHSGKPAEQ